MANKMLSNIQSLTTGVSTLTQKVNELYAAVEKVSEVAQTAVSGVQGVLKNGGGYHHLSTSVDRPGTGADGARFAAGAGAMPTYQKLEQSLGTFGGATAAEARGGGGGFGAAQALATAKFAQMGAAKLPSLTKIGGVTALAGLGQIGAGLAAGAYDATPDLGTTMSRALGYYQAGLKMPGISRAELERATFGAMGKGLSSVGSDALVAAILSGRGVTPGGADYLKLTREVGGAFRYLGMENAPAAQALTELRSGPMAANLYQYGITLRDQRGQMRSTSDIARQLMNVMTGGRGFSSVEAFNESLLRGALGANMSTMGFTPAQQEILVQSMRDQVAGKSGDLATAKPVGDNPNTMLTTQGRLTSSQTELMLKGEESMIKGFENAADTVEAFNRVLLNVIEPMSQLKGIISGIAATNVGQGIAAGGPALVGGVKKTLLGGALMLGGGLLAASGIGTPIGAALLGAGAATLAGGGGNPGFGGGFNVGIGARGGGTPSSNMTAAYGAKDSSGIWSGTNGVHKGTDFAMPIGSTVAATLGGVVSSIDAGPDYGTSVVIDHGGGLQTVYGHLSQRDVKLGDKVATGQRIGKSGDTGNTTGPHLHYEVRQGKNNPVDPVVLNSVGGLDPNTLFGGSSGANLASLFANTVSGTSGNPASTSQSSSSSANFTGAMGTEEQQQWAKDFLTQIGAPTSKSNVKAMNAWMRAEGRGWSTSLNRATYNPLNTTLDRPGAVSFNKIGVKAYTSPEQGLEATISTLTGRRSKERGYDDILSALKADAGTSAVLSAVNKSAWVHGEGKPSNYKFSRGAGNPGYGASFQETFKELLPTPTFTKSESTSPTELFGRENIELVDKNYSINTGNTNQRAPFATEAGTPGTKNVYINVKYDRADQAAALKLAKMVEGYLNDKAANSAIGAS